MNEADWVGLAGGYKIPYDPRPAITKARAGDASAWEELWENLHHQGDVGAASYAAAPLLLELIRESPVPDWQPYSLISVIEVCRIDERNPEMPEWLGDEYGKAWKRVASLATRDLLRSDDELVVRSCLGAIALAKGLRIFGDALISFSEEELAARLEG